MARVGRYVLLTLLPLAAPSQPVAAASPVRATIVIQRTATELTPRVTTPGAESMPAQWTCSNLSGLTYFVVTCSPTVAPSTWFCPDNSVTASTPLSARGFFIASYCGSGNSGANLAICGTKTSCSRFFPVTKLVPFSCGLYYPEYLAMTNWTMTCKAGVGPGGA